MAEKDNIVRMVENQSKQVKCVGELFVEEARLGKHRRCYEIPEMNHVIYEEPPIGTARPGVYHPLCCYVLAQYYFNGSR